MKVLILKGLPASGKSTFAKKLVGGDIRDMGNNWKRVNKDDLRAMLDNSYFNKPNERFVLKTRNWLIENALLDGFSVVVDDTNFGRHEDEIRALVDEFNKTKNYMKPKVTVDVKDFFDTPIELCLERNIKRSNPVREHVIWDMYNRFLRPPEQAPVKSGVKYTPPEGKPRAIICDIDGTLAHMVDRGPFNWDKVDGDVLDETVAGVLSRHTDDFTIIMLSGRDAVCRDLTEKWLGDKGVRYDHLYMRTAGDNRKDNIVKRELFDAHIRDNYQVEFVLDDRNQVVDMWRNELGLKVLQVAEGNF